MSSEKKAHDSSIPSLPSSQQQQQASTSSFSSSSSSYSSPQHQRHQGQPDTTSSTSGSKTSRKSSNLRVDTSRSDIKTKQPAVVGTSAATKNITSSKNNDTNDIKKTISKKPLPPGPATKKTTNDVSTSTTPAASAAKAATPPPLPAEQRRYLAMPITAELDEKNDDDDDDDDYTDDKSKTMMKHKIQRKLLRMTQRSHVPDCWILTSWILTWWIPTFFMRLIGIKDKQMQQAWREKVSLVLIILILCISVGFLTFGFNAAVCGRQATRIRPTGINEDQIIISGRVFNLKSFTHATPFPGIPASGDLLEMGYGGRDLSFMFQTVNYNCKGIFKPMVADDPQGNVVNYFPCVPLDRNDPTKVNSTDNPSRDGCHVSPKARKALRNLEVAGDIYYNWTDIQEPGTSLVAFNGYVIIFCFNIGKIV